MATMTHDRSVDGRTVSVAHRPAGTSGIEYRALYAMIFAVCFALAALLRFAPRSWHPWIDSSERKMSLWAEAHAAVDATVPYIFQVI